MLKPIAFAQRMQPKNAFHRRRMALRYDGGPAAAIAAFAEECGKNSGYDLARAVLAERFRDENTSGPQRGAALVFVEYPVGAAAAEERLRFRQELANFGQALTRGGGAMRGKTGAGGQLSTVADCALPGTERDIFRPFR